MGSLSVTADPHYRDPFSPLLPGRHIRAANDAAALRRGGHRADRGVVLEADPGRGRRAPADAGNLRMPSQEACDRTGALLICDEVQCGLGRTGHLFYLPVLGLRPQLVAVGKALGAGFRSARRSSRERRGKAARLRRSRQHVRRQPAGVPGRHCSSSGQLLEGGLLDHVERVGAHLEARLLELAAAHPIVREVRGRGLMRGIDLDRPAAPVVDAARARGLLVNGTARTVVRMLPPLTITETGDRSGHRSARCRAG